MCRITDIYTRLFIEDTVLKIGGCLILLTHPYVIQRDLNTNTT